MSNVAFAIAIVLLWLYLPGLLVMLAAGVRHRFLIGYAPAYSFALFAILSLLFPLLHVRWAAQTVILGVLAAVALVILLRLLCRKGLPHYEFLSRNGKAWLLTFAAVVLALLPIFNVMRRNIDFFTQINNSFDSMFHYNAVRYVRSTGDSWPTHLFSEVAGKGMGFYPILFHLIASLQSSDVILGANVTAYALPIVFATSLAALLWTVVLPQSLRRRAIAIFLVLPSAFLFYSLPATVWAYGLWPNALGMAVSPVALATIHQLYRQSIAVLRPRSFNWKSFARAFVEPLFVMLGVVSAHTSGLFAYFWMIWAGLLCLAIWCWGKRRNLSKWLFAVVVVAIMVYLAFVLVVMRDMALTSKQNVDFLGLFTTILFDKLRIRAVRVAAIAFLPLFIAFLAGLFHAFRSRRTAELYWLVFLPVSFLLAISSVVSVPYLRALTNPWYQARERVVPLFTLAVFAIVLIGTLQLLSFARCAYRRNFSLWKGKILPGKWVTVAVILVLIAMPITPTLASGSRSGLPLLYKMATREVQRFGEYITPREREFITQAARKLPKNAFIIGLPADGVTYFYALAGKHVLFYSSTNPSSQLQRDIADIGDESLEDPIVRRELCKMGHPIYLYVDRSAQTGINLIGARQLDVFYSVWKMTFDPGKLAYSSPDGEYRLYYFDISCK